MTRYLLRRGLQIVLTLFIFVTLVFFLVNAQPGDVSNFFALDPNIPPETRAQIQERFGLDQPLWRQYLTYLGNFVRGDLGTSFSLYPRGVGEVIAERLPRTVMLFATATVASFYLGFALGKVVAWRRGQWFEYVATVGGVSLYTVFTPWFGLMMIWAFAYKLGWFPLGKFLDPLVWSGAEVDANTLFGQMLIAAGLVSVLALAALVIARRRRLPHTTLIGVGVLAAASAAALGAFALAGTAHLALDVISHMVLPVATLTLISFAGTMLLTRNSMLETMREDYVLAARAKGLPEAVVRDRHVARNAILPVVTSLVFSLAFAIDGGVIIETVFSWPGMGQTLVAAAQQEDLPLAVGAFVFVGVFVLLAHLAVDILYALLDPRIRL
ncbi:MAG: ABC transporter permease [Chloroflexi bacterium]|nr:ABC transporter permease [Chloroflexota bacterium]